MSPLLASPPGTCPCLHCWPAPSQHTSMFPLLIRTSQHTSMSPLVASTFFHTRTHTHTHTRMDMPRRNQLNASTQNSTSGTPKLVLLHKGHAARGLAVLLDRKPGARTTKKKQSEKETSNLAQVRFQMSMHRDVIRRSGGPPHSDEVL